MGTARLSAIGGDIEGGSGGASAGSAGGGAGAGKAPVKPSKRVASSASSSDSQPAGKKTKSNLFYIYLRISFGINRMSICHVYLGIKIVNDAMDASTLTSRCY